MENGGDNLAATFSPELSDLTLYVIDVAGPRYCSSTRQPKSTSSWVSPLDCNAWQVDGQAKIRVGAARSS